MGLWALDLDLASGLSKIEKLRKCAHWEKKFLLTINFNLLLQFFLIGKLNTKQNSRLILYTIHINQTTIMMVELFGSKTYHGYSLLTLLCNSTWLRKVLNQSKQASIQTLSNRWEQFNKISVDEFAHQVLCRCSFSMVSAGSDKEYFIL